jgi:hypothetical protein
MVPLSAMHNALLAPVEMPSVTVTPVANAES